MSKRARVYSEELTELCLKHEAVLDAARPDAVAKQHGRGSLTARERVRLLIDTEGHFVEWGALAEPDDPGLVGPADAVIVGRGPVHGVQSLIISFDYTVLGGSIGPNTLAKLTRAANLAERYESPIFILAEGAGARVNELQSNRSIRSAGVFAELARLSGRLPLVGLALGHAFAGHAILAGMCDVVIATQHACMGIAGPPLVRASTGEDLTPQELGAVWIHEAAGTVERVVRDDTAAIAEARTYAQLVFQPTLPYRAEDDNPALLVQAGAEESDARARKVIDALTDASTQFELRPRWAPEVITTLSRIGGQSVGILATDPGIAGGKVTVDGCDKIARYIALCDAYQIPVVVLVDSAGVDDESGNAMFRHAARIPIAIANARIPIVTLIIGEVGGIMQALLGGFGSVLEGAPHLMWPGARAWGLGLSSEVGEGSSFELARWFVTDDVIHPAETRARLLALLSAPRKDRQTRRFITPW